MRAGGFARSITHQNDRFNDNKSSNKAILEGDNPKKIDNEETYDLDRVRRILEEAEATKQIGDGVSKKILSLLGMAAEECDSNVSKDDSLLDEMRRFEHDDHVQEPNSIRHEVGEGGKVSDVGLSSVLTEALVGSMFNEENEPRNRTLSTEQLQQTDHAKSNSLNPVQEATNDEVSDGNISSEYSDYQYRPRNDVEMAYFNRLFVHAGALKATDQLEGKTLCLFVMTKLSMEVLTIIWAIADHDSTGSLNLQKFYVALRLISIAQSGRNVTGDAIRSMGYAFRFPKIRRY